MRRCALILNPCAPRSTGTLHRTRPAGERSVNLTFERAGAETLLEELTSGGWRCTAAAFRRPMRVARGDARPL